MIRFQILSFERPPDWDCYGGEPITSDACRSAVAVLEELLREVPGVPEPRVSPSASGAVSLYWRAAGQHFTLAVYSSARLGCTRKGTGESASEVACTKQTAVRHLTRMFATTNLSDPDAEQRDAAPVAG